MEWCTPTNTESSEWMMLCSLFLEQVFHVFWWVSITLPTTMDDLDIWAQLTLDIPPLSPWPHLLPLTRCLRYTTLSCNSAQNDMRCAPWMGINVGTCCQGKQILVTCPTDLPGSLEQDCSPSTSSCGTAWSCSQPPILQSGDTTVLSAKTWASFKSSQCDRR